MHTSQHSCTGSHPSRIGIVNLHTEVLKHFFCDFAVCNNAVLSSAYCTDISRCSPLHPLALCPNRLDLLLAVMDPNCNNRGLIQNDAAILNIDQRICRAEVDRQIS